MRVNNSLKNIIISVAMGAIAIVSNFILQRFFIDALGVELLGLNSLFTNIISMLSVAELGLGSAIIFHLYEPLHNKDSQRISSLMRFYQISYRWIAAAVLIIALAAAPFLPAIVNRTTHTGDLYIIYGLFVINSTISYLMSYKRSILYADQKNYVINLTHLLGIVTSGMVKVLILFSTKNYYLFLFATIATTIIENLVIIRIVNKRYDLNTAAQPLDKAVRQQIFKQMRGLLLHKVGTFIITGTDNIIISAVLGLKTLGLFSNYQLIILAIQSLFSQISSGIKASIGNLLVEADHNRSFVVFCRLQFANHALTTLAVSVFVATANSIVSIWLGNDFVLDKPTVLALALTLYLTLTRAVFGNFKEAAGIFYEDRFVPVIESAVNIIASLILARHIGLLGVFIGTSLSALVLHLYSYPRFVYARLFKKTYRQYFSHITKNFLIASLSTGSSFLLTSTFDPGDKALKLLYDISISIGTSLILLWLLYHRSNEYRYFSGLFAGLIRRFAKKQ